MSRSFKNEFDPLSLGYEPPHKKKKISTCLLIILFLLIASSWHFWVQWEKIVRSTLVTTRYCGIWTANNPRYIATSTVTINTNALMFHSGQCGSSWCYFKHLSTHKELPGNNYNASSFLSPSCQLLISLLSHAVCQVTWCSCGIYLKLSGIFCSS